MRITLYDYVSDPSLPQKDGVNLAHENIASLLKSKDASHLTVEFHDFTRLLADDSYARSVLETTDCVVSNVGPHAHFYFYLRERLALDFRIVRDVRTALWSPYLLQEYLCAPYLREQDVLLAASHYAQEIVEAIFPRQRQFRTVRCYPLSVAFPPERPQRIDQVERPLTLGYIGRISEDKNFSEIVELLIELNRREPGKYKLLACGDVHSRSCHPVQVRRHIESKLGAGDYFEYMPPRHNGDIWEVYRRIDVMAFPSTSNLETLGRVLVEASYAGVPVVCGRHAAAPELMPWQALCDVEYTSHQPFNTHQDHSLGCLRIEDMADAVSSADLKPSECYRDYLTHPARFLALLAGEEEREPSGDGDLILPSRVPKSFIRSLDIEMPEPISSKDADALIKTLVPWFVTLQKKGSEERQHSLDVLLSISRYPERTRRYIEKSQRTQCDFTDVGGIDMELCHVAGFYPYFTIRGQSQVEAGGLSAPTGIVD